MPTATPRTASSPSARHHHHHVFRVEDTGSGIDSAQLPHIFERGYSGDGGSGLGLSIARTFTEACGGTFSVQTQADLFTASVSFPLTRERPPKEESAV